MDEIQSLLPMQYMVMESCFVSSIPYHVDDNIVA